jgi:hypothetical protein
LVPKRLTNFLQPAEVAWMRTLKRLYHDKWQNWLIHSDKSFTVNGNMGSPGYAQVINWISEIWSELPLESIKESFDLCGITSSNFFDLHSQLKSYLTDNITEMVEEYDPSMEIDGFDDMIWLDGTKCLIVFYLL